MNNKLEKQMEIEDELLDICYHQDEFTTSDLQGAISAQVMKAMQSGARIYKEQLDDFDGEKDLRKLVKENKTI